MVKLQFLDRNEKKKWFTYCHSQYFASSKSTPSERRLSKDAKSEARLFLCLVSNRFGSPSFYMVCVQRRAINENYKMRWESGMEWFADHSRSYSYEMKLCVCVCTYMWIERQGTASTRHQCPQQLQAHPKRLDCLTCPQNVTYFIKLYVFLIWMHDLSHSLSYFVAWAQCKNRDSKQYVLNQHTHIHTLRVLSILILFVLQHTIAIVCLESIGLTKSNVCNTYDQHKLDRIIIVFITFGLEGRSGFLLYKHCNDQNQMKHSQCKWFRNLITLDFVINIVI